MKNRQGKHTPKTQPITQSILIILLSTASLTTDAFGVAPPSQFSEGFREILGESLPLDFIKPINQYLDSIAVATIPVKLPPKKIPTVSPKEIAETLVASLLSTGTPLATNLPLTATPLPSLTPSVVPTATSTIVPTITSTATLTWHAWTSTPAPPPPLAPPPPSTPDPYFIISNISLDFVPRTSITVSTGSTVDLDYDYQVWAYDPNASVQLVSGVENNVNGQVECGYEGIPSIHPGVSGNSTALERLFAPAFAGTYDIIIEYHLQNNCSDATTAYGTNSIKQVIGEITTYQSIILYNAGNYKGNMGSRNTTDALCMSNAPSLPTGYTAYRSFLAYSNSDSIANMPTNYSIPTNAPIEAYNSSRLADDWADLLNEDILYALSLVGITNAPWWSGAENADGTHIDGTTQNCNGWTSDFFHDFGVTGNPHNSNSTWMVQMSSACDQAHDLLCIAYNPGP